MRMYTTDHSQNAILLLLFLRLKSFPYKSCGKYARIHGNHFQFRSFYRICDEVYIFLCHTIHYKNPIALRCKLLHAIRKIMLPMQEILHQNACYRIFAFFTKKLCNLRIIDRCLRVNRNIRLVKRKSLYQHIAPENNAGRTRKTSCNNGDILVSESIQHRIRFCAEIPSKCAVNALSIYLRLRILQ